MIGDKSSIFWKQFLLADSIAIKDHEAEWRDDTAVILRIADYFVDLHKVVYGDSCFVSIAMTRGFLMKCLFVIKVIKLKTKENSEQYLSEVEITIRGDHATVVSDEIERLKVMDHSPADRGRKYFVNATGRFNQAAFYIWDGRRFLDETRTRIWGGISVRNVADTYYTTAGVIDHHTNVKREDSSSKTF